MSNDNYWSNKARSRSGRVIALERCDGVCEYCNSMVVMGVNLTYDHRTPRSHGGKLDKHNTAVACFDCNQAKDDLYCDSVEALLLYLASMGWRYPEW